MKKTILLILIAFNVSLACAQIDNLTMFINGVMVEVKPPTIDDYLSKDNEALKKTLHLIYLTPNFNKVSIDGKSKNNYLLRYNIYQDEMEFVTNNITYYTYKEENQIIKFLELDKTFKILSYKNKLGYYQVISKGKFNLFSKPFVIFHQGKPPKNNFELNVPARYEKKDDRIFVSIENNDLIKLPKRKKDFYKIFGNKANEVKKFMKSNKLNRKKIDDLIKLFNYLNK